MIRLYFHATPNPLKVALLLGELELPFDVVPVDLFKGAQHEPAFRRLNPNGKVPVLVDDDVTVFDSHAILMYLADKYERFLPRSAVRAPSRSRGCSWWPRACHRSRGKPCTFSITRRSRSRTPSSAT